MKSEAELWAEYKTGTNNPAGTKPHRMPFCVLWPSGIFCLVYACANDATTEKHGRNDVSDIELRKNSYRQIPIVWERTTGRCSDTLRVSYSTAQQGASGCAGVQKSGPQKAMEWITSLQ